MTNQAGGSQHSILCLRLTQMFPRVTRGMRRWQNRASPANHARLSPRHAAALQELRNGPLIVGELAERLGLTLPTVSGVLAELDRTGYVERQPDPADRRRTIVAITPAKAALVTAWIDGAAGPIARVLAKLDTSEQEAFLKAMSLLEDELHADPDPGGDDTA